MTHQVHIGEFATACRFKATAERRETLRRSVDRTCRTRLDQALQQALDPVLNGHDGVIRIRRIDLDLSVLNPLDGTLAHDIARRIALLVRAQLGTVADGVQNWPDHAAYMAHYVLWRLGLRAGAEWAFSDFHALRLLSPQQAAVEVLTARPGTLATLAHDTGLKLAPDALFRAFDNEMATALIERVTPPLDAKAISDALKFLSSFKAELLPALSKTEESKQRQVILRLIIRLLAILPVEEATEYIKSITLLARVASAVALQKTLRKKTAASTWAAQIRALATHGNSTPDVDFLAELEPLEGAKTLLDAVLSAVQGKSDKVVAPANPADSDASSSLATPAAGLALLIPGLIKMETERPLTDAQRHAIMLAALPEDMRATTALHPGFGRLFPHDVQNKQTPFDDPNELDWWVKETVRHFAEGLPGLRESSTAYLQNQFLIQSGDVALTDTTVDVALHRIPLGIVLSMGGHLGMRGAVPWLADRKLNLSIKGGV